MNAMNESTTSQLPRASRRDVPRLARRQVMNLSAQFLLGMAVALFGQPSETTGAAHAVSTVLLGLHILVAVALGAGAVLVMRAARTLGKSARRRANGGAVLIGITFAAGVLTAITKNDWWSYAMAVGFLGSLLLYGGLLVQAPRAAQQRGSTE